MTGEFTEVVPINVVEGLHEVAWMHVSRTNNAPPAGCEETRLVASELKTTTLRVLLIEASKILELASLPSFATVGRKVEGVQKEVPAQVSRTNTAPVLPVWPGTRLLAPDANATKRPSGVIEIGKKPDELLPGAPFGATETIWIDGVQSCAPRHVSRTTI